MGPFGKLPSRAAEGGPQAESACNTPSPPLPKCTHTRAQLLLTFLKKLFSADIVGSGGSGKVRPLPGCKVVVPTSNARADYVAVINGLPDVDTPSLFCLPDNIDRTAQQVNSTRVIAQLKVRTRAFGHRVLAGWDWLAAACPHQRVPCHRALIDTGFCWGQVRS